MSELAREATGRIRYPSDDKFDRWGDFTPQGQEKGMCCAGQPVRGAIGGRRGISGPQCSRPFLFKPLVAVNGRHGGRGILQRNFHVIAARAKKVVDQLGLLRIVRRCPPGV